jgi:hypothetical protein
VGSVLAVRCSLPDVFVRFVWLRVRARVVGAMRTPSVLFLLVRNDIEIFSDIEIFFFTLDTSK